MTLTIPVINAVQSTTDLLTAVNHVLRAVSERPVNSVDATPTSLKVRDYIQEAWEEMSYDQDWSWQRRTFFPVSWNKEQIEFNGIKQIIKVLWNNGAIALPIDFVTFTQFYYYGELLAFENLGNRPQFYTTLSEEKIALNPYPTDAEGQARIFVLAYAYDSPPNVDTGLFKCPEKFINTMLKKAIAYTLARHLGQLQEAGLNDQDYQRRMNMLRSKDKANPSGSFNMFQRHDSIEY